MSKEVTYEKAESMLQRAAEGSRRLGLDDVADEYEEMSVEDYADRKGLTLTNPTLEFTERSKRKMPTKEELEQDFQDADDVIGSIWDKLVDLDENYSKEDLVEGIEQVCDEINAYDPDRFVVDDDPEEQDEAA